MNKIYNCFFSILSSINILCISCSEPEPTLVEADFSPSETRVVSGSKINFIDNSTGNPTEWFWEFDGGDPSTSSLQNPVVSYYDPGQFNVSLTVSNANGQKTESKIDFIEVLHELVADFRVIDSVINENGTISFEDQTIGEPSSWSWTFDGGTPQTSNDSNPIVTYEKAGVYDVTLEVSDDLSSSIINKSERIIVIPSTGLKAFYNYDNTLNDQSGNDFNVEAFGDPQYTPDRHGRAHNALTFDGFDDAVNLGADVADNIRSVSLWFNPNILDYGDFVTYVPLLQRISDNGNAPDNFNISLSHWSFGVGKLNFFIEGESDQSYFIESDDHGYWEKDSWYHIVVTLDSIKGIRMYIDGNIQLDSASYFDTTLESDSIATLGQAGYQGEFVNTRFFNGKIDDVRIYNKSLSAEEVYALSKE